MLTQKKNRKGTIYYEDSTGAIVTKTCAKCNEVKTLDNYPKHKAGLGGRESTCKPCKSGYYRENKESFVRRYEANKEHILELMRKYQNAHKEELREYRRNYYEENKEVFTERNREYRQNNKEHMAELMRNWRRNNPEKALLIIQRRRARKESLADDFTDEQLTETFIYFKGCALTGDIDGIHWDHVIPLATGSGGTTFGNMIPLRSDLNISKSDANIFEWFSRNKGRFNLSQDKFEVLIGWLAKSNGMTAEEYKAYVYECFDKIGNYSNDQTA